MFHNYIVREYLSEQIWDKIKIGQIVWNHNGKGWVVKHMKPFLKLKFYKII